MLAHRRGGAAGRGRVVLPIPQMRVWSPAMRRGPAAVLFLAAIAAPACKGRKTEPAPTATPTPRDAAPPRIPGPTEPDLGFEARRAELLRRGDPDMMKAAPVTGGSATPATDPAEMIKVIARDVMMVGAIRVDLAAGTAEFPAVAASPTGPIEYVLVGQGGKAYESLFVAEVSVVELRLGLTLLGFEGTTPGADGAISAATATDSVLATVRIAGKERPVAGFLIDAQTGKPPATAPWQVVGFRPADRAAALAGRELMTVVRRDVLTPLQFTIDAGNPYSGQGLLANPKALPPAGSAVTVVLRRRPDAPASVPRSPDPRGAIAPATGGL